MSAALLGAAACGGPDSIPLDELPARLQASACDYYVACGALPDRASCATSLFFDKNASLQSTIAAAKRGTTTYDGSQAAQCLDTIYATTCTVNAASQPACAATFRGTVAAGGACFISAECVGNAPCNQPAGGCANACCQGTCGTAQVPVGGDCTAPSAFCVTGAYCTAAHVCAAAKPAGSPCASSSECQRPAFCAIGSGAAAGSCTLLADSGATCDPTGPIACLHSNDYCDPVTLKCVKRKSAAAVCNASSECAFYAPCTNGVCTPLHAAGESCDATATGTTCEGQLTCNAGTCAAPNLGTACAP